ncbi:TPM domain-containing protein [uncultured Pseudodesulfovibrio sp.]|uniref:TPM domain-containing protein n=1 Tax=uncultured Pseudodesulfovibrio sp. TaxID=2035858 RepID=UPI0029C6DA32|nr:TPM domain-containing protein [uncultured Pseudodesulfovibrio sp.]
MRIKIPRVHGESPKEKVFRSLALVLVFAAVIWAFYMNNKHVVDVLNQEGAVYDETKTLDTNQKKFIVSFTRSLRDEYGMDCKIQIYGGDFVVPDLDGKTMYIGLAPALGELELRFPPMMRKTLGKEFIESLKTTFLLPSFKEGDWPMAIQEVLMEIYKKLEQLKKEESASE